MAERAGYTVTMFLIDVSASMGQTREVLLPDGPDGEERTIEMTNLEWSLQYVKLKIQEMIYNGRKTDQCGVILFGTEGTDNIIHTRDGGYEHVTEFIPLGTPNAGILAKLNTLRPSTEIGDPVDAIIVGIESQDVYLARKKTWTRKIVLLTDGENPIEVEDWQATARKMNDLAVGLTIVGIDFDDRVDKDDEDDEDISSKEVDKTNIKRANEEFFHKFIAKLDNGLVGDCEFALAEAVRPDLKQVKSALLGHELRIGDSEAHPGEGIKLQVKASKCTALTRPKSWKRFARVEKESRKGDVVMKTQDEDEDDTLLFSELQRRTDYIFDEDKEEKPEEEEDAMEQDQDSQGVKKDINNQIEKEDLIRGFKYGASFVPNPDGSYARLPTKKGIDICGFFKIENFRRDQAMGEVQYIWADPNSPANQVALSSIVRAMTEKGAMAIARWVSKDGMDPKMGVLYPVEFEKVDCFLWVQMPFADDVRKYTFASLDNLISKKGEKITSHPYIPTKEQQDAMDNFVDAMDLMEAGEMDAEGYREPWFDTRISYNPAVHRTKQAQFHGAVVQDLNTHPLPPPHEELLKYFRPPKRLLKRAHSAIEQCKQSFNVKQVPKKVARARKDGHVRASEDDEMLLLDQIAKPAKTSSQLARASSQAVSQRITASPTNANKRAVKKADSDSETESEDEAEDILPDQKAAPSPAKNPRPRDEDALMTPARSVSPERIQVVDPGRAEQRIIGITDPLADFVQNLAVGDLVTKAMFDMGFIIADVVMRPFSRRRSKEMLECMKKMRQTAVEEDEVEIWNEFLLDLHHRCTVEQPGNKDFWSQVKAIGRDISLISKDETTSKMGKKAAVDEAKAVEFIEA